MGIRRYKVLMDQTAAGTGDWYRLDSRYEEDPSRPLQINVTTGDTVTIQATTKDIRGAEDPTTTLTSEEIIDLDDFTATTSTLLNGNWTYIRIKKTGTTGNARVSGHI